MKKPLIFALLSVTIFVSVVISGLGLGAQHKAAQNMLPTPSLLSAEKVLTDTVSTDAIEFNSSFSEKYNELYFTRASEDFSQSNIWFAYITGEFPHARQVKISGLFDNQNTSDVHITPSGQQLFFVIEAASSSDKSQLYTAFRQGDDWVDLQKIQLTSEQKNKDLYYPSTTNKGHLYFSQRNKNSGLDIYRAEKTKSGYSPPIKLPSTINTAKLESDAFISPDESYLIFSRMHDEQGKGMSDLYISFNLGVSNNKQINWSVPTNMHVYNTAYIEGSAFVTNDGKTLLFTSNRDADSPTLFNGKLDIYAAHFDVSRWQTQ